MRRLLSYVIGGAVVLAAGCSEPTGSNRPLSGMVEAFAPPQLTVAGRTVLTSDATIIARGGTRLTLSAVRVGEAVEVHGSMRSDGGVDADEIDVDDDGIELRGTIDAIAAPNLTVAGRTVVTDS